MSKPVTNPLEYYARPGPMTDPQEHAGLFEGLPTDISALVQVVQGLLLHIFWAERYGVALSEERKQEVNIRAVSHMLARIQELDARPLTVARPLEKKLVGNCRDFSTLLCAMLRSQGVPARARCGFGAYFEPERYEDHWVCEHWKKDEGRWVMVDAQLDQFQRQALKIQFDPLDVPPHQFLIAGKAWQLCRAGQADPDRFGIFDMHGLWFIRGNVGRDLLSLNKLEILPWDGWGLIAKEEQDLSTGDVELLDRVATLTLAGNEAFSQVRSMYEDDGRWKKPANKDKLLEKIRVERRRLEKNLAVLGKEDMTQPGVVGEWSVKDLLAHLLDWEQRFLGWYEAGLRGEVPKTPAPGLTWGQLHILNQQIFEKHRHRTLDDIWAEFQSSYEQTLAAVEAIPEESMFAPGRYAWTGNENLAGYIAANTGNHYRWAKTLLRKWMKEQNKL